MNSGETRPKASFRTDMVTTLLGVWFVLGLFLDAWAHSNVPELESFFTPWHAVFYSGFAATGAWILWTVWGNIQRGRTGVAAVPRGYGLSIIALPVFAVSGAADFLWHTFLGIESTTDIFFSPSHLGLISSMVVILTTPLRSAWADESMPALPSLRRLLPAVLTTAFATTLVLLFMTYGNALIWDHYGIIDGFSTLEWQAAGPVANDLAVDMAVTTVVLLAPLLLLARKWRLPAGSVTILYIGSATISGALTGFQNPDVLLTFVAAGVVVDVIAHLTRPTAARRNAYWLFAALAPMVTWTFYLASASAAAGRLPAVVELWTGLLGWLLAVLMLPSAAEK
jgi:hypothetical protein